MAAVMIQVSPSFYTNYSKDCLFSANTYEKYTVRKEYCFALQDDKMFFLLICRKEVLLKGDIKELRQKMDAFCFNYQHVGCLYTLFKYQFTVKFVPKSGQLFDTLRREAHFNHQDGGPDRMPSIAEKRILRIKHENIC